MGTVPTPPLPVRKIKRLFDILLSLVVIALSAPFFVLIVAVAWLLNRLAPADAGPVFYSEIRVSHGKDFRLNKFRTVKSSVIAAEKAAKGESRLTVKMLEEDPENLTVIGSILKKVYLDELPQIFAILIGDLSFVGPRPWPRFQWDEQLEKGFDTKGPLPGGLTGLYQCHKGEGLSDKDLDLEYIEAYRSKSVLGLLWLDLTILARTLKIVVQARGI